MLAPCPTSRRAPTRGYWRHGPARRPAPAASPPSARPAARTPADPRPAISRQSAVGPRRRSRSASCGLAAGRGGDQGIRARAASRRIGRLSECCAGDIAASPTSRKPAREAPCISPPSCCSDPASWAANSPSPPSGSAAASSPATAMTMRRRCSWPTRARCSRCSTGRRCARRSRSTGQTYRARDRGDRYRDAGRAGERGLAHRALGQGGAADHEPRRHPRLRRQGAGPDHLALPVRRDPRRGDRGGRDASACLPWSSR